MLYKTNRGKTVDMDLFRNPTSEYRGTPFWAWNCILDRERILRQIDYFKEMGFGGFHMHSRVGMASTYLGEEFMGHIRACVEKAKEENLLAWLYDEDRWASGSAGGYLTKEKKYRKKGLHFTRTRLESSTDKTEAFDQGIPYFLAAFDVCLDPVSGELMEYKTIGEDYSAKHAKWYAYVITAPDSPWFNNQSYPDMMDEETMAKFIEITYDAYAKTAGDEFDKTVPAIFTDEPNIRWDVNYLKERALDGADHFLIWSRFYEEKYYERYGEDIVSRIPELIWVKKDRSDSKYKYRYYDFCAECFAKSYADQCGKWCEEHGIALMGHLLYEVDLQGQVNAACDNMRQYRSFTIPGIDMLCDRVELTTAKQCQSVVHQMGREAMMSELYGVTNWDYDFRGHKFQGDWQAALGVTVRVPHLAWMSMGGESKRDYPAPIFYQSSWYKKYPYLEDHYARLNTVLTRGKAVIKVGVIHPTESFWLQCGPNDQTGEARQVLEQNFARITEWLLAGHHDFNYINESLLPMLEKTENPKAIGEATYDAIVIPDCTSLRATTINYLKRFRENGGKVVFMGMCPTFVDGEKSDGALELYAASTRISFNQSALMTALEEYRQIDLRLNNGLTAEKYLYQLREDGDDKWLFIARFRKDNEVLSPSIVTRRVVPVGDQMEITLYGEYYPSVYDTLTGNVLPIHFEHKNGNTVIYKEMFASDSLLLRLATEVTANELAEATANGASKIAANAAMKTQPKKVAKSTGSTALLAAEGKRFDGLFRYIREEKNVLLLDRAEYRMDEDVWEPAEEILRLDNKIRARLGYPMRRESLAQPWVVPDDVPKHIVTLRYYINSDIEVTDAMLAMEDAKKAELTFNGEPLSNEPVGWYVDEAIQTVALPTIPIGQSVLTIKLPFSLRANLEASYIIGDFDVKVRGTVCSIDAPTNEIGFGSITTQGMPFYGGNITYCLPIDVPEKSNLKVHLGKYIGALCEVMLDESEPETVAFEPYDVTFEQVSPGAHTLKIRVYGNRYNTFGSVHNFADNFEWYGPNAWRTVGDYWGYEYALKDMGMMTSPSISFQLGGDTDGDKD